MHENVTKNYTAKMLSQCATIKQEEKQISQSNETFKLFCRPSLDSSRQDEQGQAAGGREKHKEK